MSEPPTVVVFGPTDTVDSEPIKAVRTGCSDVGCELREVDSAAEAVDASHGSGFETDARGTLLVAIGSERFRSLVDHGPSCPILPIGAVAGVRSVPRTRAGPALRSALGGSTSTVSHPVLSVSSEGASVGTVVWDCSVCTAPPARISEFRVGTAERSNLGTVRADGVVVATPAGSYGYASAIDGPLLGPETGLAVVPIAPFQRAHDRWVVSSTRIDITVRRDEVPVSVRLDGSEEAELDGTEEPELDGTEEAELDATGRISITPRHDIEVLQVPESVRGPHGE